MSADKSKTSRRAFVMSGGATLGAGVAAAAGAAGIARGSHKPAEPMHADREAIRQAHARFIADVENALVAGAAPSHRAYRSNARQKQDTLTFSTDGRRASAIWNVDVKTGAAIEGDSTIEQMARLQGMLGEVHWEAGRLEASYARTGDGWQMTAVSYTAA